MKLCFKRNVKENVGKKKVDRVSLSNFLSQEKHHDSASAEATWVVSGHIDKCEWAGRGYYSYSDSDSSMPFAFFSQENSSPRVITLKLEE